MQGEGEPAPPERVPLSFIPASPVRGTTVREKGVLPPSLVLSFPYPGEARMKERGTCSKVAGSPVTLRPILSLHLSLWAFIVGFLPLAFYGLSARVNPMPLYG